MEDSAALVECLEWKAYRRYRIVAYNCMGDLFVQPIGEKRIGYVWLQYGYGRFVADDLASWVEFLRVEPNRTGFLESRTCGELLSIHGSLP